MSISIQGLNDTIVALIVTVGIAAVLSIALGTVGFFYERSKARGHAVAHAAARLAQHPTQTDKTRELVLR